MKKIYTLLGEMLQKAEKEQLVKQLPLIEEAVVELIVSIRKSENYEVAKEYIYMLYLSTYPLATLYFNYHVDLKNLPKDIFRFENIYDEDVRQNFYLAIKKGQMFGDIQ